MSILASGLIFGQEGTARVYGVCDVLADPAALNGGMIELRGIVETGGNYKAKPVNQTGCGKGFVVKGRNFEDVIVLADPRLESISGRPQFDTDHDSYSSLVGALRERKDGICVVATAIGLFQTRVPISGLIDSEAPYLWVGFGEGSRAPAQLLVKRFSDIKLVPGPCKFLRVKFQ